MSPKHGATAASSPSKILRDWHETWPGGKPKTCQKPQRMSELDTVRRFLIRRIINGRSSDSDHFFAKIIDNTCPKSCYCNFCLEFDEVSKLGFENHAYFE